MNSFHIEPIKVLNLPMADVAPEHQSVTGKNVPGYKAAVSSNYIVGRNLSLLLKAAIFCAYNRVGEIAMAPLEANPLPDARPVFFAQWNAPSHWGSDFRSRFAFHSWE